MGNCPLFILSDDKSDESIVTEIIRQTCVGEVCSTKHVKNITLADDNEHRFLVCHAFDDKMLIDKLAVIKIHEIEREAIKRQQIVAKSVDDGRTDITTGTRVSKTETDATLSSSTVSDDRHRPTAENTQFQGAKDKLNERHKQCKDEQKEENVTCIGCQHPLLKFVREDCALHLSMKANLVEFFQSKYIELFPDKPSPVGVSSAFIQNIEKRSSTNPVVESAHNKESNADFDAVPQIERIGSQSTSSQESVMSKDEKTCVQLERDGSLYLNLAVHGALGLLNREESSVTSFAHQKIVISNLHTDEVIAVCKLRSLYGPPVVRILATKPRVYDQVPSTDTTYRNHTLYSWAEFRMEGEFPLPVRYSMSMATGNKTYETVPRYKGSHRDVGSPNITILSKMGDRDKYGGCCLLSLSSSKPGEQPKFSLKISEGIDPALFICFTAIVDEILENTMRHQYQSHQRKINKSRRKGSSAEGFC